MRFLLVLSLLFSYTPLSAQLENTNWHFGCFSGINFAEDGSITQIPSSLQSREGTASISDENGNLLFYTDGVTIYNDQNIEVATNLLGDPSSTSSAAIIPVIGNSTEYWIFTTDIGSNNNGLNYYRYSTTTQNIVQGPVNLISNQTEKLAAVLACNEDNYWLTTQTKDGNYLTYSVGSNVTLNSDTPSTPSPLTNRQTISYLKFSEDGTKLANALPDRLGPNDYGGQVNIYNFNPADGEILNPLSPIVLDFNNDQTGDFIGFPYGVQFAPGGRYLYVTVTTNDARGVDGGELYQFDLQAADVNSSRTMIGQATNSLINYGNLQLASDGKIYMAMEGENDQTSSCACFSAHPFLGVIETPDEAGVASSFTQNALPLGQGNFQGACGYTSAGGSKLGLPFQIAGMGSKNLATNCNTMPISLTSFNASLSDKNNVLINWQTASESQSATFHVEHSVDGINWSEISVLPGAGEATTVKEYEHIHNQPAIGLNFYRLRHTNFDASFTHSEVQVVKYDGTGLSFRIYPNPATNEVNLLMPASLNAQKIYVIDASGRVVIEQLPSKQTINVARLPQGTYFIKITTLEGPVFQRLVVVKRV